MTEATGPFRRPRPLEKGDPTDEFTSESANLNLWLARFAWVNHQAGMTHVYVSEAGGMIAGFYAISTGGVEPENAPDRTRKGVAKHAVPVIVLTRLAVDTRFVGNGLGRALLRDALVRVESISRNVGVRSLLIHAADTSARDFYMHLAEFEPSPTDPLHLFLLMKDLRKAIGA